MSSRHWQTESAHDPIAGHGTTRAEYFDVGYSRRLLVETASGRRAVGRNHRSGPWRRLAGHSVAAIARTLNDDGVPCPSIMELTRNQHRARDGWTRRTVAAILANPEGPTYETDGGATSAVGITARQKPQPRPPAKVTRTVLAPEPTMVHWQ